MQTHAYGYLGIGPPIGPPRGVCSIPVFTRMLSSEHLLGECSLRLDSLRSHAKRPASSARAARDSRAGSPDLSAPF